MMDDATITVRQIHIKEDGYVNFEDTSGKRWNCNKQKYLGNASDGNPIFHPGRKLDVAYNTTEPKPGKKYGSKYIEECRPSDKPNTWPDKEPFQGRGQSSNQSSAGGNGSKAKGEFRSPDQIMRSNALHSACVRLAGIDSISAADVLAEADAYYTFISGSLADKGLSNGGLSEYVAAAETQLAATPDEDIPF
jgi:hypothetical protein